MVHQHFVSWCFHCFENIILEKKQERSFRFRGRVKVLELSKRYGLEVDLDAYVKDLTVSTTKVEILKMLYRDAEI